MAALSSSVTTGTPVICTLDRVYSVVFSRLLIKMLNRTVLSSLPLVYIPLTTTLWTWHPSRFYTSSCPPIQTIHPNLDIWTLRETVSKALLKLRYYSLMHKSIHFTTESNQVDRVWFTLGKSILNVQNHLILHDVPTEVCPKEVCSLIFPGTECRPVYCSPDRSFGFFWR